MRESSGQMKQSRELRSGAAQRSPAALFLRQFLSAPGQIGAIAPSSIHLARRMMENIDFESVRAVAEFGPGAGVFTQELLSRVQPGTKVIVIEKNPVMAAEVRRRFPQLHIHETSAEDIADVCVEEGLPAQGGLDAIISGLPFAAFPDSLQDAILGAAVSALRPGGWFVTFAYYQGLALPAGRRFAAKLPRYFRTVERSRGVLRNLPPAFVYRCST